MPTVNRQTDLREAAVAVVLEKARVALEDEGRNEYIDTSTIAATLVEQGVLEDWHVRGDWNTEDRQRKSAEGKVRRVLDKEVASEEPRILRFSSRDHELLPRSSGSRRGFYGNTVVFTTPEVFEKATAACAEADAKARADQKHMDALLRLADDLGLPTPKSSSADHVTFEREDFRVLVARIERVRTFADWVERDRREPDKLLCHVASMRREEVESC